MIDQVSYSLSELFSGDVFCKRAYGVMPTPGVISLLKQYMDAHHEVPAERQAVEFYFCHDFLARLRMQYHSDEPLPVETYATAETAVTIMRDIAKRLVYYTLLIVTRESRHAARDLSLKHVYQTHGDAYAAFHSSLYGKGSSGAVSALLESPPDMYLENYVKATVAVFSDCKYGNGYGGPAWAAIAQTLFDLVSGNTSLEVFADTAFTLAHNGGPMFNKGMLYSMDKLSLLRVLDIQNAGQIPAAVVCDQKVRALVQPDFLMGVVAKAQTLLGSDYCASVDWAKVVAGAKLPPIHYPNVGAEAYKLGSKKSKAAAHPENCISTYPGVYLKKLARSEIQ